MYVPGHFEETNADVLHGLLREHPLGALVTQTPAGLDANHIPFVVHADPAPNGTLHGHVARANPVWRHGGSDPQVLVIFRGPEAFISPSWYPTKQETGRVVPTWNYVVVHAHGPLRAIDDRAWLRRHLEQLTTQQEGRRPAPWRITDAPPDYVEQLLGALVGIEIPIARLVGKWKLSQNRSDQDRHGVVAGLIADGGEGAAAMARLVREGTGGQSPPAI